MSAQLLWTAVLFSHGHSLRKTPRLFASCKICFQQWLALPNKKTSIELGSSRWTSSSMLTRWLAQLPHSKKTLGLTPPSDWGLSVCSSHVLPGSMGSPTCNYWSQVNWEFEIDPRCECEQLSVSLCQRLATCPGVPRLSSYDTSSPLQAPAPLSTLNQMEENRWMVSLEQWCDWYFFSYKYN